MLGRTSVVPVVLLAGLLAGCAGDYLRSVPKRHPANAQATQAPAYPDSGVLAMEEPLPDAVPPEMKSSNPMGHMRHESNGKEEAGASAEAGAAATYVCPMHREVSADKPGRCPKCGMTLKKRMGGDR